MWVFGGLEVGFQWVLVLGYLVTGFSVGFQWVFVFSGSLMGLWVRSGPLVGLRSYSIFIRSISRHNSLFIMRNNTDINIVVTNTIIYSILR